MAGLRVKRSEIWYSGMSIQCLLDTCEVPMLQVILGSFGVFPIFKNLVRRKQQVLQWKIHLEVYVIQFYVVIVYHLDKQSAKPLGFLFKYPGLAAGK